MKRSIVVAIVVALVICALMVGSLFAFNLAGKDGVIRLYERNEEVFLQAAATGDYSAVEDLFGVRHVNKRDTYVEISCGGLGLGASTNYYGIFYYEGEDLREVDVDPLGGRFEESGDGYLYEEENGDNHFYIEPLGNHFYYYEAHF